MTSRRPVDLDRLVAAYNHLSAASAHLWRATALLVTGRDWDPKIAPPSVHKAIAAHADEERQARATPPAYDPSVEPF